jgi:hypothetical protein
MAETGEINLEQYLCLFSVIWVDMNFEKYPKKHQNIPKLNCGLNYKTIPELILL